MGGVVENRVNSASNRKTAFIEPAQQSCVEADTYADAGSVYAWYIDKTKTGRDIKVNKAVIALRCV